MPVSRGDGPDLPGRAQEERELEVPVAIISFNRPHYLERLCATLKAQSGFRINDEKVVLVQDGAVSAVTGRRAARDEDIAASVAVFRSQFPKGQVLDHSRNLGIALNIRRGEQHLFQTMDQPVGYFFEDDLELGPHYIGMMEQMRRAFRPEMRVAYWAAYGDRKLRKQGPAVGLIPMAHLWGFGLTRRAWRQIDAEMRPYFDLLKDRDYRFRPKLRLMEMMATSEFAARATSQDAFRGMTCARLGLARVMTDVCFARYIGAEGVHFRSEKFEKAGWHEMTWAEGDDFSLAKVTPETVEGIRRRSQNTLRRYRQKEFEADLAAYRAGRLDEDRLATREDVDALYRLLLDRVPPTERVYAGAVGKQTVRQLRRRIVNDEQFRLRNPPLPQPPAAEEDAVSVEDGAEQA